MHSEPQQLEAATPWEARIDELMREVGRHTDVQIRKSISTRSRYIS